MAQVFEFTKGSHPKVTHVQLSKIIWEIDSVTIEYSEGFMKDDEYQSLGVASKVISGDNYTSFADALKNNPDPAAAMDVFMINEINKETVADGDVSGA